MCKCWDMIYDIMHPGWGEHHLPWVRKEEDDRGDWGAVEQDFDCSFFKLKNWRWMRSLGRSRTSPPLNEDKTEILFWRRRVLTPFWQKYMNIIRKDSRGIQWARQPWNKRNYMLKCLVLIYSNKVLRNVLLWFWFVVRMKKEQEAMKYEKYQRVSFW